MKKRIFTLCLIIIAFSAKSQNYQAQVITWDDYYCAARIIEDSTKQNYLRLTIGYVADTTPPYTTPFVKFYMQGKKQKFDKIALSEDDDMLFVARYPINKDWDTINLQIQFGQSKKMHHKTNIIFTRDIPASIQLETMDSFLVSYQFRDSSIDYLAVTQKNLKSYPIYLDTSTHLNWEKEHREETRTAHCGVNYYCADILDFELKYTNRLKAISLIEPLSQYNNNIFATDVHLFCENIKYYSIYMSYFSTDLIDVRKNKTLTHSIFDLESPVNFIRTERTMHIYSSMYNLDE